MFCAFLGLVACDETEEAYEYDNWESRNNAYIDSIAKVARANVNGKWRVILDYALDKEQQYPNDEYVYCEVLQNGNGEKSPFYTDTVSVNYRGRLIPSQNYKQGYIFDETYHGEFDAAVDVPVELYLPSCVKGARGIISAVTEMVTGDTWRIYIPYNLGYGAKDYGDIPAFSTLVFDLNLVGFSSEKN